MKVSIDDSACQGTGYCARIAPDIFEVRDSVAVVKNSVNVHDFEDVIREAAVLCPAGAIIVTE